MLIQAQSHRQRAFEENLKTEAEALDQLKGEIELEKRAAAEKRRQELADAVKIINENEQLKRKKDQERMLERIKDNDMLKRAGEQGLE